MIENILSVFQAKLFENSCWFSVTKFGKEWLYSGYGLFVMDMHCERDWEMGM